MNKSSKLGFSLIELSVVILVIGILVIGITQGSRIISEAKLKSARALTISSPVNSNANLILWLDSISEKSFDTNVANGSSVATWYDLTNQNTTKNNATQVTPANQPVYTAKIINGMPALVFSSANSNFMSFDGTALVNKNYSIIVVEARSSSKNNNTFIGDSASNSFGIFLRYSSSAALRHSHGGAGTYTGVVDGYSSPIARVLSFTYDGSNGVTYVNGLQLTTGALSAVTSFANAAIGGFNGVGNYYDGGIGEVIIFNRLLKNSERQDIENYLKQKWGI
jgi:prepilin-type N-terminal cleavage/methylation domain-containing protein